MAKYIKKPIVIEAHRIGDDGWPDNIWQGVMDNRIILKPEGHVEIHTLEGVMRGNKGDWIIRGVKGEFYPCKSDVFEQTYERIEEKNDAET